MGPLKAKKSRWVLSQDVIPKEKAAVMAQNFRNGGHIKELAQVLWDWQSDRSLKKNQVWLCLLMYLSLGVFLFHQRSLDLTGHLR